MRDYSQDRALDEIDKAILHELQQHSRISNVELANRVQLSPPAVHSRIKRLEQLGYIDQYTAIINREKVGYDMVCFINVSLQEHQLELMQSFGAAVQEIPEVLECYSVTGDYDYLLKVLVQNRHQLELFIMEKLASIAGIARINTNLVLSEVKNTTQLVLD